MSETATASPDGTGGPDAGTGPTRPPRLPKSRIAASRLPLAWRTLLLLALLGTALGAGGCLLDLHQTESIYGGRGHPRPPGEVTKREVSDVEVSMR